MRALHPHSRLGGQRHLAGAFAGYSWVRSETIEFAPSQGFADGNVTPRNLNPECLESNAVLRCHAGLLSDSHCSRLIRHILGCLQGVIGLFLLACLSSAARGQELLFNGVPFDQKSDEVLLNPGVFNHAELVWRPPIDSRGPLTVNWELRIPDRQNRVQVNSLTADSLHARFELGPLADPPVYEFEDGQVFQKGYHFEVRVSDATGRPLRTWSFYQEHAGRSAQVQQGMGETRPLAQKVRFATGSRERVVYNPQLGSLGPLSLRLDEGVLVDQDHLEILAKLNAGDVPERMRCDLRVTGRTGEVWREQIELARGAGWSRFRIDATGWPGGEFKVELLPMVEEKVWPEGPQLRYRRSASRADELLVSPVAPWRLRRDPSRGEIHIVDFRTEVQGKEPGPPQHWRWLEGGNGRVEAASDGDYSAAPLVLRPKTRGYYAVFVTFEDAGGLIQVGRDGLIRGVALSSLCREPFVEAADLTDNEIRIFPSRDPRSRLVSLRLVPVTQASARTLIRTLARPPIPLFSVNDWAEYFGTSWSRLLPDQFTAIVGVQAECGFRTVGWSVGRSWVEYPSKLPHAHLFPCVPYEEARKSEHYPKDPYDYGPRIVMMNQYDPLAGAYEAGKRCGAQIWPWLAMERHYSESMYGGIFCCPFYREHPEWRQVSKDGKPSGLSFYYPGVRNERVDILMEVAERGADGLLVGCDRQVPMLRYEPALVQEFRDQTGIDPLKIDVSNRLEYERWIRFRAEFFTRTLRELKRRLEPLRAARGSRIPVGVRIPTGGLFLNLAQGLDVETWCREGLVDLIDLDPLEESGGEGSHDVRPYLSLAHKYGIPVIGGIGSSAFRDLRMFGLHDWDYSVITAGLKRARGLHRAGVDGIDTFETEILTWTEPVRFVAALYGHPEELERFLEQSNIEAVYPVDAGNAAAGHDNHSVWRAGTTWSMSGFGARSW